MRYTPGTADEVFDSIEAVVKGLAMSLIELSVSRQKSGVYVRAIVYRKAGGGPPAGGNGTTGASGDMTADETDSGDWKAGFVDPPAVSIDDCARVHRAILPRLELAFPKLDIYIEVSSPGIERKIKDGAEFAHYIGRPVSCYRTDISGWTSGILVNTADTHIVIKGKNGMTILSYDIIAKAKLTSFASIAPDAGRQEKEAAV